MQPISRQNCDHRSLVAAVLLALLLGGMGFAATFGTVVAIGGHASDIALDEARGVLYIANFSAARVDVLSLRTNTIQTSIQVGAAPGSLDLSPDGRYLLVAHFGNFNGTATATNSLTVIQLDASNARRTYSLASPPLGVAFGFDNRALVATATEILLFDPVTGQVQTLSTIADLTAKTLPVPAGTYPPNIVEASFGSSADRTRIYGVTNTIIFTYDVARGILSGLTYTASPPLGPRVVSVSADGGYMLTGWALRGSDARLISQYPDPLGEFSIGSHAIDSVAGVIYAQIPAGAPKTNDTDSDTPVTVPKQPPVLQINAIDNLAVLDRIQLAQNLTGRGLLNASRTVMYAISESGVTVLPVGSLGRSPRLAASKEDLLFRSNFCEQQVLSQDVTIVNPGGGNVRFFLSSSNPNVRVSPGIGTTPAVVTVTIDPAAFRNTKGTVQSTISIASPDAVNIPRSIRVLVNNKEPDQRGSAFSVPGKLVDLIADPARKRFYVLRQDTNEVLVFNGGTYEQVATLRTSNTPTQMTITFDRKYLLIGHDNSQLAYVYDLDTLEYTRPVRFPGGHYPRSIAAAGNTILAAVRSASGPHQIDKIDLLTRTATPLDSLGVFKNDINISTVLTASPNGQHIFAAMADGTMLLYNSTADTFVASRKDNGGLAGSYAASSFDVFSVGGNLLDSSMVTVRKFEAAAGKPSGFVFVDQYAIRTTTDSASAPGVIQRVDLAQGADVLPTRIVEAPLLGDTSFPFTRTLAVLNDRSAIISLTQSGFTALPWNFDAAGTPPVISRVVSAADQSSSVAPGSLITIYGSYLSAAGGISVGLPGMAVTESCLTVNGIITPMLFGGPGQINAQLPYNVDGIAVMVLRTAGGVSNTFRLQIFAAAPGVFRFGQAGPETGIPTVVRVSNNELVTMSNPIHQGDEIVIYAAGLGRTDPEVPAGTEAPFQPLARTILKPVVTLGGVELGVYFSGLTPGQIGVYQINAIVPESVPTGFEIPLVIRQADQSTTLPVRVVR